MNSTVKIWFVYSLWFGFIVWISFWFITLTAWILTELLPAKTNVPLGVVMLVAWIGFISVFAWLPMWWMKRTRKKIAHSLIKNFIFVILLSGCTAICTFAWDRYIAGTIYNCTDSVPFDFLHPGDWVHSQEGRTVVIVPQINPIDPMDKPDSIKQGWGVPQLWFLWWAFIFVSVAISATSARLIPDRKTAGAEP